MLELGLLLTLQLTHGGSMADTLGLEDIRTAIRYTESLFPTSKGMLEPEVLRHLPENLASAPGASIGEKSSRVERGISFVTAPHVQFLPTGVVEFEDFLAVLSVTSATAARWVAVDDELLAVRPVFKLPPYATLALGSSRTATSPPCYSGYPLTYVPPFAFCG